MPLPDPSFRSLLELLSGHSIVRSLGVVAELGVADALANGPLDAAALAQRCNASADALGRVMRMLAAVGVFTETADPPRYGLTTVSELLRTDAVNSMRDFARLRGGAMSWGAWTGLEHSVRTGDSGFVHIHGADPFVHFAHDPAAAKNFDDGVRALSRRTDASVIESYDFSRFSKVLDVGGGRGGFIAAILRAHPHLRGILLDMATPLAESGEVLRSAGVADRCEVVVGDFFQPLPKGADVAILSHVIHNWGDDEAARILRNCRDAVPPGSPVLILEYGLGDDAAGLVAKQFDLQMLVYFGSGRERTVEEYRKLVARAGMTLTRVVPTSSFMVVIEARAG